MAAVFAALVTAGLKVSLMAQSGSVDTSTLSDTDKIIMSQRGAPQTDPREREVNMMKQQVDSLHKTVNELYIKIQKLTVQRNQLAAGLLDLQQSLADTQDELTKAREQSAPKVEKEEKK